jgi:DNA-binding MarR family transcriptional regulator
MQTTDPTATRTVDALAAQRLAARVEDPSDRRGVLISATHQGRRLVEERRRRLRDALATTMAEIPLDEQQRLAELLYHLNGLLDRNRPRAAASLRG